MSAAAPPSRSLRILAGVLGFLAVGVGHLVLGRGTRGVLWMASSVACAVGLVVTAWIGPGAMFVAAVVFVLHWLASVADVILIRPGTDRPAAALVVAVALVATCVCTSPFAVRGLFVEAYRIPSGAMQPALLIGDHMLVDKRPFVRKEIRRGDVVVFEFPFDRRKDYIERVVGLPGDSIGVADGRLFINGEETAIEELGEIDIDSDDCLARRVKLQKESVGDAVFSIVRVPGSPGSLDGYWIVPAGEFFVMGDNRDNSADSRTGFTVPFDHVKGKATRIYLSWDSCRSTPRLDRFWLEVR